MEPDVAPGFRRREEDGRAGGRDRFMSSVSAVVPRFRPQRTPRARTYPALTGTAVRTTDGPMLVLVWVNVRPGGLTQGAMAARRVDRDTAGPGSVPIHPMTSRGAGTSRALNTSPVTPSIAAAATDRACTSRPTLVRSVNTGASLTRFVGYRAGATCSVTHESCE